MPTSNVRFKYQMIRKYLTKYKELDAHCLPLKKKKPWKQHLEMQPMQEITGIS